VVVGEGDLQYEFNPQVRKWIAERKERGSAGGSDSYAFINWVEDEEMWVGWWYPATKGGSRTFTIKYVVHGGIRIGDKHDQLYWKAIFKDHDVSIGRSTVTVNLPEGISRESLAVFSYGVPAESSIEEDGTVQFVIGPIPSHEELEIQVIFPHGVVSGLVPAWQVKVEKQEVYNADVKPMINLALIFLGVVVIPICGGIWIWRAFRKRGAAAQRSFPSQMVYSPPGELPPALVGLITKTFCGAKELVATIFNLARKGVIEVVEAEKKVLFLSTRDVMLVRTKRDAQYPFERLIVDNLASEEGSWLSKKKTHLQGLLREFKTEVEEEAVRQELFTEEPSHSRRRLLNPGFAIFLMAAFAGIPLTMWLFDKAEFVFVPFVTALFIGLVAMFSSSRLPARTEFGQEQYGLWKGFERYLKKLVKDRSLVVDKLDYWDNYFPYAVIFGMSKVWISTFAQEGAMAPAWFYMSSADSSGLGMSGASMPSLQAVSGAFHGMVNSVQSSFSSGGTSGGGSSGGGGGGGGGGGSAG
jgi:uncharacterized membrane protein